MAFPLQRALSLTAIRQSSKCHLPSTLLLPRTLQNPRPQTQRQFTQSTYETFFASQPPDPWLWNDAIWCSEFYLSAFHDNVGLPWGWGIVLGTMFLRTVVTLPLLVYGEVNQDRLHHLREDVENRKLKQILIAEIEELSKLNPSAFPDKKSKERLLNAGRKRVMKKEYQEWNCHPAKALALPIIQIPLWIASSVALRNMSGQFVIDGAKMSPTRPDLAGESFLWMSDLTLPDASFAIPFLVGLTFLVLTEINVYKQFNGQPMGRRGKILTNLLRGVSVFVMPTFAYLVPATLSLYWLSSGLIGLIHNIIVMTPSVRRTFGITLRASPHDTPGKTIWRGFKGYWKL